MFLYMAHIDLNVFTVSIFAKCAGINEFWDQLQAMDATIKKVVISVFQCLCLYVPLQSFETV